MNETPAANDGAEARTAPYRLAELPSVTLITLVTRTNAALNDLRRVLRNVTILGLTTHEMHDGLRKDTEAGIQALNHAATDAQRQAAELEKYVVTMGSVVSEIAMRLDYYESHFDLFKRARRSFDAHVLEVRRKQRAAEEARNLAVEGPTSEPTPPEATGPQLVPDEPLSEGDSLMGTGELDEHEHVGYNND